MSLEQYKDASRKELWEILQIQQEVLKAQTDKVAELEEKLWRTEQESEQAITRAAEMIEKLEEEEVKNERAIKNMGLAIAIAQEWTQEKDAKIAELEKRITQLTRSRKQFPNSRGM